MSSGDLLSLVLGTLVGVVSSLVASLVYLFVLLRIRPKVEISGKIARATFDSHSREFQFKVINRCRSALINLEAHLFIAAPDPVVGGTVSEHRGIPLKFSRLIELPGYRKIKKGEKIVEDFAWRFLTYEDLDALWNQVPGQRVIFRLVAQHSVSGFSRVFTKEYFHRTADVLDGEFEYGDTFAIARVSTG